MDINKYNTLIELVREAKVLDTEAFDKAEKASIDWKAANKMLTERTQVLNDYVRQCINSETVSGVE